MNAPSSEHENAPNILELTKGFRDFADVLQQAVVWRKAGELGKAMAVASNPSVLEAINSLVGEPTKRMVRDIVQKNGIEDDETKELLVAWTDANQARIELTTEPNDPRHAAAFLVTTAWVYLCAGYFELALQSLHDAKTIAIQTEHPEIIDELRMEAHIARVREALDLHPPTIVGPV